MAEPDNTEETIDTTEESTSESAKPIETTESQPQGKNAKRKERWRREGKLPREGVFSGSSNPASETPKSDNKSQPNKPFPFQQYRETAKKHSQLVKGLVDKYFATRGAVFVEQHAGAFVVRSMTCDDFGEITYYTDKKVGAVKGPIAEAIAFHMVIAGEGSINWLDGFIERHRGGVSTFMLLVGIVYIESTIRSNAQFAIEIERRARAAQNVAAVENPSIEVK